MATVCSKVTSTADIKACYPIMKQLRKEQPWMSNADTFAVKVQHMQQHDGFELACLVEQGAVRAVAGYRFCESLCFGKELYVQDLVTDSASRSKGYGRTLLAWLHTQAAAARCSKVWLTSGSQRLDAHRFYASNGMSNFGFVFVGDV